MNVKAANVTNVYIVGQMHYATANVTIVYKTTEFDLQSVVSKTDYNKYYYDITELFLHATRIPHNQFNECLKCLLVLIG